MNRRRYRQSRRLSTGQICGFTMSTCPGFNMVFFSARADGRREEVRLPACDAANVRYWHEAAARRGSLTCPLSSFSVNTVRGELSRTGVLQVAVPLYEKPTNLPRFYRQRRAR